MTANMNVCFQVQVWLTANMNVCCQVPVQVWLYLSYRNVNLKLCWLNFVQERKKHVYRIIFTRYSLKKKTGLVQASENTITHTSKLKSTSKYQLLTFHL